MRNLAKNKQKLYYALYLGKVTKYKKDEYGNKIVVYTDYNTIPPTVYYEEDGQIDAYGKTDSFYGNIALSGGDSTPVDFGVDLSDYEAILVTEKNLLPITETSLIWQNTEPKLDADGYVDPSTADYKVIKVSPSLNEGKYILAKVVK